jgi:hypothetical protein
VSPSVHTAQRRNKWVCALKNALKECQIFGPSGNPDAEVPPKQVTLVPYEAAAPSTTPAPPDGPRRANYNLADAQAALLSPGTGDIFGEEAEVRMPVPSSNVSTSARPGGPAAATLDASLRSRAPQYQPPPQGAPWASAEEIEMRQREQQPR